MIERVFSLSAVGAALVLSGCSSQGSATPGPSTGGQPTAGMGGSVGTGGTATAGVAGSVASGGTSGAAGNGGAPAGAGGGSTAGFGGLMAGSGGDAAGSGGVSAGTGGSGGLSAGAGGSGGVSAGAGGAVVGGAAGMGGIGFSRPQGTIPNNPQPANKVGVPRGSWAQGLVTPTQLSRHHLGQPSVVNGYLVVGGNEEYWIYDVSNIAMPRQLSAMVTPNRCVTCGPKAEGEAEAHTVSFAKYGSRFYMVTTGGRGIDTWDVTDPRAPMHLRQLTLPGVDYGDFTNAVWGLAWQGTTIYVGSTNNGIDIIDATDPANLVRGRRIATNTYGGVSAGPVEAVGNILVVMTPKESGGVATLDISDPTNPVPLDSFTTTLSYIGQFYRHYVFLQGPVRAWDVLTNPTNIGSGTAPIGSLNTAGSEYMSFSDDFMFLGHLRPDAGVSKINVTSPTNMSITTRIWGRLDQNDVNDDQFTISLGNVIVMADDEAPYAGLTVGVHAADPDTKPPVVDTVIPKNGETGRSVKSRVGISFSDNIELATVNEASFIVRPMGGQPIPGKWGLRMGVLNFDPDQDLLPATTYEVVLPAGGLTDLVGNALAQEFRSTFVTR
jgi:hypothetical protein